MFVYYDNTYENVNILTSDEIQINNFLREVNEGHIKYYKVEEIFEEIKQNKYTEEEAITIINNIIIATTTVLYARFTYNLW